MKDQQPDRQKDQRPGQRPAQRAVRQPAQSARRKVTHQVRTAAPRAAPKAGPANRMSLERLRRIERRKARNRAVWLAVFVLLIMFLTVVMIITIMQRTRPKPRFQFIQTGEIARTIRSTGLILRDEQVFNAPAAGTLKPLATEGSRVAKGQKVALIIPANKETQLRDLQKCEKDIVDLQNQLMNSGKGAGARAIFDESRAQLSTLVNLVRSDTSRGDLSNLHAYSTSMDVVIDQRNTRLLSIDFKDVRLDQLKAAKTGLEKTLGLASGTLICQNPGIISFRLDGLATKLTTELGKTLSFTEFKSYRDSAPTMLTSKSAVEVSVPVLRITSSLSQILCFEIAGVQPEKFVVDQFYELTIPNDGATISNCRVIRSEPQNGSLYVVFRTDRKVEWLADRRTFEAELTVSRTKGMKVLLSAIRNLDPESNVGELMIVNGGYTRIGQVHVVDRDREYAIIEAISGQPFKPEVSTVVVLNPSAIEEGAFIGS